jgi:hypothetical protein
VLYVERDTAGGVLDLAGLQKTGLKAKFDEQARGRVLLLLR